MARRTLDSAIRKNKSDYYRLMTFEARENERIHHMKKRIKLLAEDEQNSLALQTHLSNVLAQLQKQKTEHEQAAPSKERNKTLKKVEKEFKEIDKKYKRTAYHLAVIETQKEKDNVTRLILKEAKRDEIRVRAQAAYTAWKQFEQLQEWEAADFEAFHVKEQTKTNVKITKTASLVSDIEDTENESSQSLHKETSTRFIQRANVVYLSQPQTYSTRFCRLPNRNSNSFVCRTSKQKAVLSGKSYMKSVPSI